MPETRRGRPTLNPGEASTTLHLSVSASDYDRAFQIARRQGVSVPHVLRQGLRRVIADDDRDRDRDE